MTPQQQSSNQGTARAVPRYLPTSSNGALRPRRWRRPPPALLGRARPGTTCAAARGPRPVATRAAARGTSHGPSSAAAMEDCPAVAFGRWASCPEMCAAAPGREEDRGRGKVAAGLTHWRSESMRGLEVRMEVRRSEKQNRNATSNDLGDTRETDPTDRKSMCQPTKKRTCVV